jgi:hypothetical protein
MQRKNQVGVAESTLVEEPRAHEDLRPLIEKKSVTIHDPELRLPGVVIGELVAVIDEGRTPLVAVPGHAAVRARATVDVHGAHVGRQLALMFENADPALPVIVGILRTDGQPTVESSPGTVDLEADGERLIVSARQQLVLRCGKARITLTRAGKVLIEGTYISSRSSGVNRLKGGSVHLN